MAAGSEEAIQYLWIEANKASPLRQIAAATRIGFRMRGQLHG